MPTDFLLKQLADNPALLEALKVLFMGKFTLSELYADDLSNEQLGAMVRGNLKGKEVAEEVFKEIMRYQSVPEGEGRKNPGR